MSAKNTSVDRSAFYRYRTSVGLLKRFLRGERMSDAFLCLVASNVIGVGCEPVSKAVGGAHSLPSPSQTPQEA